MSTSETSRTLPHEIRDAEELISLFGTEPQQEFNEIAELAAAICGTPISSISLLSEQWQYPKAAVGVEPSRIPRAESVCQYTVQQDGVFVIKYLDRDARFASLKAVQDAGIRFYAGAPLYSSSGARVGALCVMDTVPRELKKSQIHALTILARQVNVHFRLRQQSEALLESSPAAEPAIWGLVKSLPFLCAIRDRDGRLLCYNAAVCKYFGITATEWIGKSNFDLGFGHYADLVHAGDEICFQNWKAEETRISTVDANGLARDWVVRRNPLVAADGAQMLLTFVLELPSADPTSKA
ncbi:GAF domain-containing protein [Acidipila sp. EB88]|uniref:GAF domain-containing protein n=1 Tax=Acidipila sp. EB88 TaxID=2305226 RepID=UPI000F5E9E5A|nr:GAF domain-containing protein [Acidipila sp. EB88]RRA47937.1 GAF domain-containing protein [Acidipila sp. EB88]